MNPLMRVAFVALVCLPLLWSLDVVSAGVTLVLELATVSLWRGTESISVRRGAIIAATVGLAVVTSAIVTLLYGRSGGIEYFAWGPVRITELSVSLAVATGLRVAALVVPSVLVFATLNIAEFADSLIQIAHLPARFVWGAVAGLRLIDLTASDFTQVRFARRARGLPSGPIRSVMPLLVLNLRRAESLALAMEARGFDGAAGAAGATGVRASESATGGAHQARRLTPRTNFRTSKLTWKDGVGIAVAVAIGVISVTASVSTGEWHFVLAQ